MCWDQFVERSATTAVDQLTVGVEEEFFLVGPDGLLVQQAAETIADADDRDADLKPELLRCQVESASEVCRHADELVANLRELRGRLADGARAHGARLLATSTTVREEHEQAVVGPDSRYQRMVVYFGSLVFTGSTCGCHVHVGIDDRETALQVSNHLRPWLPMLLALSANSPFNNGHDTGYASSRYLLWGRWPTAGPPPYLDSLEQYESIVAGMLRAEAALDRKMVYWDVRPSEHQPTLELRVCDVAGTAEEAALYGTLVRALVGRTLRLITDGAPATRVPHEVLRAGMWRAARDGLEGQCPDPVTGQLRPVHQILRQLVDEIGPILRDTGEMSFVDSMVERLRGIGGGAARQRLAYARHGRLEDVVDMLAEQTIRGTHEANPRA
jgi:carboxylate-amine ligase